NFNIKNGKLLLDEISYTDEATYQERISRSQPYPGDLIITREAPMGEVCIIPDGIECCLGQRLVLIKPNLNKINNKYLLYALLSEYTQKQIQQSNNTGSIVSNLRIPLLKNLDIPLNNNQDKIAAVLSYLDDKIEINNRINSELENLAKTIYDYWFVQFDFPDENGKPYKSCGGKMVYNQELKRAIPAGWEVKKLSNIADITMGQSPDGESYNEDKKGEIFFQGSTDFGWRFPTIRQYTTQPSRMAKKGDILLSVRAPVGTLNIADNDCCIGRGLAALRSKSGFNSYLFYVMEYFKKTFDHRNNIGTTFGSITKD
ncbi:MAG: restriction endonuclease subunit S, partial [Dolichospermum sp.]